MNRGLCLVPSLSSSVFVFFFYLRCILLGVFYVLPASATQELAQLHYVGSSRCITCHQGQGASWQQSHHAQSMQVANARTVLGDFNDVKLNHHGQLTKFFRRDGKFFVRTSGPDGKPQDFPISYTFGVHPLQQYLIALPGGRLQALGVAWDGRSKEQGGQRWYHLYPETPPQPGESTHWTGREQNWNFMCASCHSTGVRKNYDQAANRFNTVWSALNVACESCHGPGSVHLTWAKGKRRDRPAGLGLVEKTLVARGNQFGFFDSDQKIASLRGKATDGQATNEVCLGCHSRRQTLVNVPEPGAAFLDQFLPSLIEKGIYHADGQVNGEVFEAGSYWQSAMHRAGVACSNCHNAHSLKLRAQGNDLCAQCHRPSFYNQTAHHHHLLGSVGAQCVNCHMPSKTFMGVHERRDHSLRVPRPDLSLRNGTPNACNQCHAEKSVAWAAQVLAKWNGPPAVDADQHFSLAIDQAWLSSGAADRLLMALQKTNSAMAKASLLSLLPSSNAPMTVQAVASAAQDGDGLVRLGAARALNSLPDITALSVGLRLLDDPLLAVRIEAARAMAGVPAERLTPTQRNRLQVVLDELIQTELVAADRPESHVNLALIYSRLGRAEAAEKSLRDALRLDPNFVPALVNLAEVYRGQQRDGESEALLRRAIQKNPAAAAPAHALGLVLIRLGRREEALLWLQKAAELEPGNERYAYVLMVARKEIGRPGR